MENCCGECPHIILGIDGGRGPGRSLRATDVIQQFADHVVMTIQHGNVQRRLTAMIRGGVVGTFQQQKPHNFQGSLRDRAMQRCGAVGHLDGGIRAGFYQQLSGLVAEWGAGAHMKRSLFQRPTYMHAGQIRTVRATFCSTKPPSMRKLSQKNSNTNGFSLHFM